MIRENWPKIYWLKKIVTLKYKEKLENVTEKQKKIKENWLLLIKNIKKKQNKNLAHH